MRVDRISYKRNFLIDPHTLEHEHVGVEIILEPFETVEQGLDYAKVVVESWQSTTEHYVHLNNKSQELITPDFTEEMTALESYTYREDAMNYLKLRGFAYFKQLTNIANEKPTKNI